VFAKDYYEYGISYTDIMRKAINLKYSMIKYMYTHLFLLSKNGGKPFYRPLFMDYPDDINCIRD
jgi:alpha-glucosidase (family GH31 glycosyl hydrolase)